MNAKYSISQISPAHHFQKLFRVVIVQATVVQAEEREQFNRIVVKGFFDMPTPSPYANEA
jgi:hypothetical protein